MSQVILDLHHWKHENVPNKVMDVIERSIVGTMIVIITGNSPVMKTIVMNIINQYGLKHSELLETQITTWKE